MGDGITMNDAYQALEICFRLDYKDLDNELEIQEELRDTENPARDMSVAELSAFVGKSEEELQGEYEANGTFF